MDGLDRLVGRLAAVVGEAHVLTDDDLTLAHVVDWTGRFRGRTPAVVRPGTVTEVAAVVAECASAGVAIVPQGGNTGLVGGGVPMAGEVVIDLRRLDALGPVDPMELQVTASAGVTLAALQRAARAQGLAYAVDLAARDTATVGGMVATNAGGIHVLRWGDTRRQLVGIEAVFADGSVVRHLAGLAKDNTGYDLAGLLCGSEGTLGVITAARLRLVPEAAARVTALVGFASVGDAVAAVAAWRRALPSLEAAELVLDDGLRLVCEHLGVAPPWPRAWAAYVLVDAAGAEDPTDELAAAVAATPQAGDVAVGVDGPSRAALWAYREEHTAALNALGAPHKLDVTVPLRALARFVDEVPAVVAAVAPAARTWLFGHLGDGNIHVNVTGVAPDDEAVDDAVLRLVAARGGSISAEHGIGTAKRRWLHLSRTPAEVAAFRAIKRALDPAGVLNPGALLPPAR